MISQRLGELSFLSIQSAFLPLNQDHTAKGMDQQKPPNAPMATTVAKVMSS